MPVFKVNGKLCYFAHVPKCGGSSIENYIKDRFGHIGLKDGHFRLRDEHLNWAKASPQHIDWKSLQFILPAILIDDVFAVVRHPVKRMVSAYNFQVTREKAAAPGMPFAQWLAEQIRLSAANPFHLDNHIRPQADFIPQGATIFHLEHGLDAVIPYLDQLAGNADGPRVLDHVNKHPAKGSEVSIQSNVPDADGLALIAKHYAVDFERFGYDIAGNMPRSAKPALSGAYIAARDLEVARSKRLGARLIARVRRRLRRL